MCFLEREAQEASETYEDLRGTCRNVDGHPCARVHRHRLRTESFRRQHFPDTKDERESTHHLGRRHELVAGPIQLVRLGHRLGPVRHGRDGVRASCPHDRLRADETGDVDDFGRDGAVWPGRGRERDVLAPCDLCGDAEHEGSAAGRSFESAQKRRQVEPAWLAAHLGRTAVPPGLCKGEESVSFAIAQAAEGQDKDTHVETDAAYGAGKALAHDARHCLDADRLQLALHLRRVERLRTLGR